MSIKINKLNFLALKEIIKKLGDKSIGRCRPYIEENQLFFEVSIRGQCKLSTNGTTVTICIEDCEVTINQNDFFTIIIL